MTTRRPGSTVFAALLIALGIVSLVTSDFAAVWQPVPKAVPARGALLYLSALVSLGSGAGLLFRRTAAPAARTLLVTLVLWVLVFRVPAILRAPLTQDPWSGIGETLVFLAAASALYAQAASAADRRGRRTAQVLYGLALIPFGSAHFAYLHETAALVPAWLPLHVPIAGLTGAAFIAAGAAVVAGVCAEWAVVLSTLQMGLFTVLVWFPILAAGSRNPFHVSETVLSCALTISGRVVADSFRAPDPHPAMAR